MENCENPELHRYTVLPIQDMETWQYYKLAEKSYWVSEEIDKELLKDEKDWVTLDPKIQKFLKHILAFFVVSDGLFNETIDDEIVSRVQSREAKFWYNHQAAMENIHNLTYGRLIETCIKDPKERAEMFDAMKTYPVILDKVNWVKKWLGKTIEGDEKLLKRLDPSTKEVINKLISAYIINLKAIASIHNGTTPKIDPKVVELLAALEKPEPELSLVILVNCVMEGIFFTGSFASLQWVYSTYGKMPGLAKANEFISRDEGLHTQFGQHMYRRMQNKLSPNKMIELIDEAVQIEGKFIKSALPSGLLGMNADLMLQYIKCMADQMLINLGYDKHYGVTNPFTFMDKQSTSVRSSDFFTKTVTEYGKHSSGTKASDSVLTFDDNF